jgi:hypothetical protein
MSASEQEIRLLTDAAVRGDANPVCDYLKPLVGLEERYAVLHAISDQNKADRKANPAIPELDLYMYSSSSQGISMFLKGPSAELYGETTKIAKSDDRSWYLAPDLLLPKTVNCAPKKID